MSSSKFTRRRAHRPSSGSTPLTENSGIHHSRDCPFMHIRDDACRSIPSNSGSTVDVLSGVVMDAQQTTHRSPDPRVKSLFFGNA